MCKNYFRKWDNDFNSNSVEYEKVLKELKKTMVVKTSDLR